MRPLLPLLLAAGTLAAGCTPLRSHQGYIVDADLVNSVQPGVDNRQSVLATLGTPSFASQFNQGDWYYVSRDSRNLAFTPPKARDQLTMQISFDQAGNVTAVRKSGAEQIAAVKPDGKTTPTLGRKRGFFQDLFGNIGTVGAAGAGGGGGPGGSGP
jgi:outer membrane protein assembly factor BamE (lipoprotein component of BamABCDE complex)